MTDITPLSGDELNKLVDDFEASEHNRMAMNAVTAAGIDKVARNYDRARLMQRRFSTVVDNGTVTHQDRSLHDGRVFLLGGQVDEIAHILAHHRLVGRDDHGIQAIDLLEFKGFGIRSTGHACQLVVQTEVVLEGDGGQGLVLVLDLDPFLRFDRLVQTV